MSRVCKMQITDFLVSSFFITSFVALGVHVYSKLFNDYHKHAMKLTSKIYTITVGPEVPPMKISPATNILTVVLGVLSTGFFISTIVYAIVKAVLCAKRRAEQQNTQRQTEPRQSTQRQTEPRRSFEQLTEPQRSYRQVSEPQQSMQQVAEPQRRMQRPLEPQRCMQRAIEPQQSMQRQTTPELSPRQTITELLPEIPPRSVGPELPPRSGAPELPPRSAAPELPPRATEVPSDFLHQRTNVQRPQIFYPVHYDPVTRRVRIGDDIMSFSRENEPME